MPLDTCITNVGEYYSSHSLDSTFASDVKDLVAKWNERGSEAPPRRLQTLAQYYFRAKTQALDEELPIRRQFAGEEARGWHVQLLSALGYNDLQPFDHPVEGGDSFVPTLGRVNRYNKPWLVVCEAHFCLPDASLKEGMPSEDPLGMEPFKDQLKQQADHTLCAGDWSRCVGRVFTEEDAPRWILLLAGSQVLLLDRNTFAQGRFLSFDLDDAFGRKEKDTFNHIAAFLSAESLCPDGESDEVLLDKLEEKSHKFAHGVTENLQYAVREAIELLVNEWARDRTEREKRPLLKITMEELKASGSAQRVRLPQLDDRTHEITAEHLRREALTFVYRLLFCFYAEARGGELEILPVDDNIYRLGYSLESLRDLELVPLTDATAAGTYFHQHLKRLFQIIHSGFHPQKTSNNVYQPGLKLTDESIRAFVVRPLTATLFSPDSTPLLDRAELSNRCLQQVIRYLSLSKDDRSRTVGRVNYAELGINQLGAVYEGLLSYKGMFADQELIHVKSKDRDFGDKKTPTWFVPKERLEEFAKDEVERLPDGKPRIYRKGEFILHLNGIDREQSASYYTPEVLTKCLVEEALRELLKDYTPDDADKILELKICEPAMGSGAFLNEAAEQLALRYLELKQKQLQEKYPDGTVPLAELSRTKKPLPAEHVSISTGDSTGLSIDGPSSSPMLVAEKQPDFSVGTVSTSIEPSRFGDELRRVKHYIATNNIYGVDLNETAVELGQLSLWLGSIHRLLVKEGQNGSRDLYRSGATPWFGLRLRCGNSLIGARRAVWTAEQLKRGEHGWASNRIQEAQTNVELLAKHTTPEKLGRFKNDALRLFTKIHWDEMLEDAVACRDQVIRFAASSRDRNPDGLSPDEKKLFEQRQGDWKWVHSIQDQQTLLAIFDLLPDGAMRRIDHESIEWFLQNGRRSQLAESAPPDDLSPSKQGNSPQVREPLKPGLPRLLKPGESRADDEVYHFLVFDPEMVPTRSDALMKSFWKADCAAAAEWVKKQVAPKWKKDEITEALAVCNLIDTHWHTYAQQRAAALAATACTATVWPIPSNSPEALAPGPTLAEQERICRELESTSGSFQRLRLVMDTWCSFWFWPLDQVSNLPSRDAFLASTRLLLSGERPDKSWTEMLTAKLGFEVDVLLNAAPEGEVPDTQLLAGAVPWFGIAETIHNEQTFHHWELAFAEVLGEVARIRGFDLIVGNPPWIRADWSEGAVLSELEPWLGVKEAKSAKLNTSRANLVNSDLNRQFIGKAVTNGVGIAVLLNSPREYDILLRMKANLYKNFIVKAWRLASKRGVVGLLHPEGPYDDANGAVLRRELYPRLIAHYHYINQLMLFSDVDHNTSFSVNIYGEKKTSISFAHMSNVFSPLTISRSRCHLNTGEPTPGIKSENNNWETRPHANRLVRITENELMTFVKLLEEEGSSYADSRLPQIHSMEVLRVFLKVADFKRKISDLRDGYFINPTTFINETTGQQRGLIVRHDAPSWQPSSPEMVVLSGSHIHVANPFNKTARTVCNSNLAFDDIDITSTNSCFLPRTIYEPLQHAAMLQYAPKWSDGSPITDYFRFAYRAMISHGTSRSFIGALIPKHTTHIHGIVSIAFKDAQSLCVFAGSAFSVCLDFLLKITGRSNLHAATLEKFPLIPSVNAEPLIRRALRLSCLTSAYTELWLTIDKFVSFDAWTSNDARLCVIYEASWSELSADMWTYLSSVRSDFARRQALLEIDVLVAISLSLSLDELITVYRVQFPVMKMFEIADEYDSCGIRVPNTIRKDQGGTEFRTARAAASEHFPEAYKTRPATDALSAGWPFSEETSIPVAEAQIVPNIPEFASIHRFIKATKNPEVDPNAGQDGPPSGAFTAERIAELQAVYGAGRVPLMLDVSWKIDDGLQTVTKTFYPPFTKVDREADYARAWEVFSARYGEQQGASEQSPVSSSQQEIRS